MGKKGGEWKYKNSKWSITWHDFEEIPGNAVERQRLMVLYTTIEFALRRRFQIWKHDYSKSRKPDKYRIIAKETIQILNNELVRLKVEMEAAGFVFPF